jgi:hypothetical protein
MHTVLQHCCWSTKSRHDSHTSDVCCNQQLLDQLAELAVHHQCLHVKVSPVSNQIAAFVIAASVIWMRCRQTCTSHKAQCTMQAAGSRLHTPFNCRNMSECVACECDSDRRMPLPLRFVVPAASGQRMPGADEHAGTCICVLRWLCGMIVHVLADRPRLAACMACAYGS